jgi:hypothetical protein
MSRSPGLSIGVLILLLATFLGCASKRKSTLEIPEGRTGIVGYGSLISLPSMEQSLEHKYEGPIHEVHVKGYERAWECVRLWRLGSGPKKFFAYVLHGTERVSILGAAELDLFPNKKSRINGVLYLLTDEELLRFDEREQGYRRVDVTDEIMEFRIQGGKVYVYVGLPPSPPDSSSDEGTYILIKEFLDLVTNACDSRGSAFREEFDKSTRPCEYEIVSYKDIVWEKVE